MAWSLEPGYSHHDPSNSRIALSRLLRPRSTPPGYSPPRQSEGFRENRPPSRNGSLRSPAPQHPVAPPLRGSRSAAGRSAGGRRGRSPHRPPTRLKAPSIPLQGTQEIVGPSNRRGDGQGTPPSRHPPIHLVAVLLNGIMRIGGGPPGSRVPDSNRRHPLYKRGALPTELTRRAPYGTAPHPCHLECGE